MTNGDLAPHTQNYPPKSATEKEELVILMMIPIVISQDQLPAVIKREITTLLLTTLDGFLLPLMHRIHHQYDQLSELY